MRALLCLCGAGDCGACRPGATLAADCINAGCENAAAPGCSRCEHCQTHCARCRGDLTGAGDCEDCGMVDCDAFIAERATADVACALAADATCLSEVA